MLSTVSSNRPFADPAGPFSRAVAGPALRCAWIWTWGTEPVSKKRAAAKPTLFARIDV
jgi:hypothetical protein